MAGLIPPEQIQEIRERSDLVQLFSKYTEVRRAGSTFKCCCPFHNERTPSMVIYADQGSYHCYGCGAHGDVFSLVMEKENLNFQDAIEFLARPLGIEIQYDQKGRKNAGLSRGDRDQMIEIMDRTTALYEKFLWERDEGAEAREYLESRGLNEQTCKRYRLGWAPGNGRLVSAANKAGFRSDLLAKLDVSVQRNGRWNDRFYNRLMFPICDRFGNPIAFSGRLLPEAERKAKEAGRGVGKYINSTDTPLYRKQRVVYNLHQARVHVRQAKRLIVMEGPTDVMAADQAGYGECVAVMGTAFTPDHARQLGQALSNDGVLYLLFDGDSAGQQNSLKAVSTCLSSMVPNRVAIMPEGADPSELLAQGGDSGRQQFEDVLTHPINDMTHLLRSRAPRPYNMDGRERWLAVDALLEPLAEMTDHDLRDVYIGQIAEHFNEEPGKIHRRLTHSNDTTNDHMPQHVNIALPELAEGYRQLLANMLRHPTLRVTIFDELAIEPQVFPDPWRGVIQRLQQQPEDELGILLQQWEELPGEWSACLLRWAQEAPTDLTEARAQCEIAADGLKIRMLELQITQLEHELREAQDRQDRERCALLFADLAIKQREKRELG